MKKQRGYALLPVLLFLGIGSLLIPPTLSLASTLLLGRQMYQNDINTDYASQSAIEYGMWRLNWEPGFATNLPIGEESPPFTVTVNGVDATTSIVADAPPGQLSGAPLATPAEMDLFFKVDKQVVVSASYQVIAFDGFESHNGSGGTGAWNGSWTLSGDYFFDTSGEYAGSYHLRLRGDDNTSPGDGYAQRSVNLSGYTEPYLEFWARMYSLESSDNDNIEVRVSTNGTDWDVLEVFDHNDDDNVYRLHRYDLTSYGSPSNLYLSFKLNGDNSSDTFWVDNVQFVNSGEAEAEPGVLTEYTYYVTLQCMDPDGCTYDGDDWWHHSDNNKDLETITDELPKRGADSGDYLQYVPGSTDWDAEKWGISPFEPSTSTSGSGSDRRQSVEWEFDPHIDFEYGEVKTMNFRAWAALQEGVYCNTIYVDPDEEKLRGGGQAKIIVGNPADTRCSGGLLEVSKTCDTPVIYPDEETTLTYTITIKNVDTIPITIYGIEDWLPSTAVTDPTFEYVANSAHAQIDRLSFPVLFYDGFSRADSNTVSYWTDGDGSGSNVAIDSESARLSAPYSYYGNQFLVTATSSIGDMNSSGRRSAMRFTAQTTQTVSKIRVYLQTTAVSSTTYQTPGAIAYSASSGATSIAPAYPASISAGDLLVMIIGMKPSTANSGSVTTPSGWTAITSITGAGGYGATLGADTGNTNLFTYYKVAAGTESGTLPVTIATSDISWAQMYRFSNATGAATGLWSVAGTTGSDTTAGNVSITFGSDPGVTAGDYILGAMSIPTDVTTPIQFSAEALSQAGITFGTVTEISEPDSSTGNDIGGVTYYAPVNSGTSAGVPTFTATAGGTTTDVRGPGVFIRVRQLLTYRYGLQGNSGGNPSGTWLGATNQGYGDLQATTTGWQTITLNQSVSLTAGTIYHLVVQPVGVPNGSNYIALRQSTPQNSMLPYNGASDTNSNTLWSTDNGLHWSTQDSQPIYLLETSAPAYEGNPYETTANQSVYGVNYVGESIIISGGDRTVTDIGFYVRRYGSTPNDNLYYQIRDSADTVIRSGTLVAKTAIDTTYSWYDASLSSPLTLTNGSTYRVNLYSTNTNSSNYYQVLRNDNTDNAAYNGRNYNGTGSVYCSSTNSGSSWTNSNQYDIPFRLTNYPDVGITEYSISTVGFSNIFLSYRWSAQNAESSDSLFVEWKPSSSSTWNTLAEHPLDTESWHDAVYTLPSSANDTTIDIRFCGYRDSSSSEYAMVDNVKLYVEPLSIAFDGFETGNGNGGTGWNGSWTLSGAYSITTSGPYEGTYHLWLRSSDGYAKRSVNLGGYTLPYLQFWADLSSFESGDTADVLVSTNGTDWDVLRTFVDGDDDYPYSFYQFDLSSYGSPSTFYVAFDANMSSTGDHFYIDNVEFIDMSNSLPYTPIGMPDSNEGTDFLDINWNSSQLRNFLQWDFSNYPKDPDDPYDPDGVWDAGGLCGVYGDAGLDLRPTGGYWWDDTVWDDENPSYLELQPGETLTVTFQAAVTLHASGSYYNEVFVWIEEQGWWHDEGVYSWPTGGVTVPQFDLQTETISSLLRANAQLTQEGIRLRSWHWWWRR